MCVLKRIILSLLFVMKCGDKMCVWMIVDLCVELEDVVNDVLLLFECEV